MSKCVESDQFLIPDIQLPDHTVELTKADEIVKNLKCKLKQLQITKQIDAKTHTSMYEEIVRVLDYVGRLSKPLFEMEESLERMYVLHYPKSPQLAKKLCNDHYETLHYPYTIQKNRCFKMLEDLDKEYIKRWGVKPPNWNI
jgi:hypothetical protein